MTSAGVAVAELCRRLATVSGTARLDAEVLLAQVLGCGRAALRADPGRCLSATEERALATLAARRLAGEPVAYLTGQREFWSLELEVTPAVLVPRPETELLVELALAALAGTAAPTILDLGTGSGALALALATERPDATVVAVDLSAAALAIARRNAARLGLGRIEFLEGSWYEPVEMRRFTVIVANPPYVASDDPVLTALCHEPRPALAAGPEGLDALRIVCAGAPARLAPGGTLIVEHGATQGPAVRELCLAAGLANPRTHRDLAGHERATQAVAAG
ncbi:MAG: peptide chain release factor N(5)-glutamine methyltransferase [Gammaproteobacteria bacterium]|nr:MAG: peptide chain release factor N(5)-glutamine methyltransferase [Gammaproteobacteria bacterium]